MQWNLTGTSIGRMPDLILLDGGKGQVSAVKEILDEMNIQKKMCDDGKERYMYNVKITKVFLGAAMSDKQKAEIHSIISSEVEVVEMRTSDTKYELL